MTHSDVAGERCPVREDFDPFDPVFLADPYAVLAALPAAEAPVFYPRASRSPATRRRTT